MKTARLLCDPHRGNVGQLQQNANSKQQDLIENHMGKVLLEGSEGKKRIVVYMDIIHNLISD